MQTICLKSIAKSRKWNITIQMISRIVFSYFNMSIVFTEFQICEGWYIQGQGMGRDTVWHVQIGGDSHDYYPTEGYR